jgi:membrane-associated phospholipid phosphatase
MLGAIGVLTSLAAGLTNWDRAAFHAINGGLACPALDRIMPTITDLGLGHVQFAGLLIAAWALGAARGEMRSGSPGARLVGPLLARRHWLAPAVAALVVTGIAVQAPKRLHRERPSWFYVSEHRAGRFLDVSVHTIEGRRPLRVNGFPSGHTATTAAIAIVLWRRLPRKRGYGAAVAGVCIMTLAIGLSRIYMADHWPLDVLGGVVFGVACAAAVLAAAKWRRI